MWLYVAHNKSHASENSGMRPSTERFEAIDRHLSLALDAGESVEKDYHVRSAMQLLLLQPPD